MALELYLNGRRFQLYPGGTVAMSYSANKISEAIRPSGSYSNTIKGPKTQINIDIVEAADSLNSDTDLPYTKFACRLVQDGQELISDGFAILVQSTKDYEFVCYGGNLDFFEKIKDKKLSDLDFSALDHLWNMANVIASRTATEGYIYPIIDWSSDGGYMDNLVSQVDARTLFPTIFDHWLVSKIVEEAEFNKSGNILADANYLSTVTPVDKIDIGDKTKKALTVTITNTDAVVYPQAQVSIIEPEDIIQQDLAWNLPSIVSGFTSKAGYEIKHDGKYKIDVQFDWVKTGGTATFNAQSLWSSGFFAVGNNIPLVGTSGSVNSSFTINATKLFFHTQTQQRRGNFIQFYIALSGLGNTLTTSNMIITITPVEWDNLITYTSPYVGYSFDKIQFNPFTFATSQVATKGISGETVYGLQYTPKLFSFYDAVPDMSQADFIKFIAQKHGIIFQTNSFTKTVEFKQFKEIYDNIPIARNWSAKLHLNEKTKPPTIKFHPDYAQENILAWTNDTDRGVGSTLGQGKILVADASLPKEKTLFKLPFSATEMVKRLIDKDVPIIQYLELGIPKNSVKPRNLIIDRQNFTLKFVDGEGDSTITTDVPLCYFQLDSKTFNLGFDNSLITDNYNEFNFFLDKYKAVIVELLLDSMDISELDFFIPIYLDYFKQYFFISKINNFVQGKPTSCELIKM